MHYARMNVSFGRFRWSSQHGANVISRWDAAHLVRVGALEIAVFFDISKILAKNFEFVRKNNIFAPRQYCRNKQISKL